MSSRFRDELDELEAASASPAAARKLKQLCREVYRVLVQVWTEPGVFVVDVVPAPDGSRLAVQLGLDAGTDPAPVLDRLQRRKGYFRSEIAAAIQRKKTPELVFEVVS